MEKTKTPLKKTVQILENIVNGITDSVTLINNNHEIIWANKAMLQQTGFETVEEIYGKKCYEQTHLSNAPCDKSICPISDIIKTRKPKKTTHIHYDSKKNKMFVEITVYPIINENGKITEHIHLAKNITEKKIAEEERKDSEEKYRKLIEAATDAIFLADYETGTITEANQQATKLLGKPLTEIIGLNQYQLHPPSEKEKYIKLFKNQKSANGKNAYDKENLYVYNNNKKRIAVEIKSNILHLKGRKCVIGIFRDITERIEQETKLKEKQETYKSLVDYSPDGVLIHVDNKIIFANPATLEMIGIKKESEIINKSIFDFVLPQYHKQIKKRMQIIENGTQTELPFIEIKIKRPDEKIMDIESKAMLFVYERKMAILAVLHDLSTRKQLEKERLRTKIAEQTSKRLQKEIKEKTIAEKKIHISEEKLKQSLEEKEVLLKELHHRVKNNLQVITSILNLQSSYVKDQKTIEVLRESQNRIKSMSFIHENLYQSKKIATIDFSKYIADLSKNLLYSYRLNNSVVDIKLKIEKINLNIDIAIPCGLIVNELVSNALKYAFPDNQKGEIEIAAKNNKKKIMLTISDNGIGLPKGLDYKNTDTLGLKLVKSLAEQIQAKMIVDTTSGTKYNITFKI